MTEKLKPCPFCGGEVLNLTKDGDYHIVQCAQCGTENAHTRQHKLIEQWNRRSVADEALAALKEIAAQKRTDELETECDVEYADFEEGYDACINRARAAIAKLEGGGV